MKMFIFILKIVGTFLLFACVILGSFALWALSYHKKLKAEPLNDVDLSKVKNGTYEGRWEVKMWTVPVRVVVADHKIVEAKVTKEGNNPAIQAENELLARVIKKQSFDVDAIAMSTITTKAVLKSTELALEKGL